MICIECAQQETHPRDPKYFSKQTGNHFVYYLSNVDIQRESSHKPLCYFSSITNQGQLYLSVHCSLIRCLYKKCNTKLPGFSHLTSSWMTFRIILINSFQSSSLSDIEIKISYFDSNEMKEPGLHRVNRLIPCMTVKFSEHFKLHGSSSFINVQALLKELDKWLVKKHCIKLN